MKIAQSFRHAITQYITDDPWLYLMHLKRIGKAYLFPHRSTDLVIEGFPRSANTFSMYLFREACPDGVLASHVHYIASLKSAQEYNIPTIILYRDPVDAVVSTAQQMQISHENATECDYLLRRWYRFYSYALKHEGTYCFANFEDTINNPESFISGLSNLLKLSLDPSKIQKCARDALDKIHHNEKKKDEQGSSLPRESRNEGKAVYRENILKLESITQSSEIFELLKKCRQLHE